MHEHGLADELVEALLQQMRTQGKTSVVKARIQVSELSGLRQEPLQAAVDHVCEHLQMAPIGVELVSTGLLGRCAKCEKIVEADDELCCRECGSIVTPCADEALLIESIEFA